MTDLWNKQPVILGYKLKMPAQLSLEVISVHFLLLPGFLHKLLK